MLEKAQDNISKRAAVDKKPSTFGKDNEDRNIIYAWRYEVGRSWY